MKKKYYKTKISVLSFDKDDIMENIEDKLGYDERVEEKIEKLEQRSVEVE
jgi:hypothetical protein